MTPTVRELAPEERPQALSLVWRVFREYEAPDYTPEGVDEFYRSVHRADYLARLRMYGAFAGTELRGVIATRDEGTRIALFFVDGGYHRQGIGRQLFQTALADCPGGKMTVHSAPYAVPVYRKLGFAATGAERTEKGVRFTPMELAPGGKTKEETKMELIRLTRENLEREHICCAIASDKDIQVASKKAWLRDRLDEGLLFLKGDVRGKCFIEYLPAEYAWAPVEAPEYMYIDCLWVSGQLKGQGYSTLLLDRCIADSREKGKRGLVILSAKKKLGFLSDPAYLRHKGFETADAAEPYFELMYLPLQRGAPKPRFRDAARRRGDMPAGFALYYTNQCPFTAKYVPLLEEVARRHGAALQVNHIQSGEEARNAPSPFTTFSLFYNGAWVTHEILSEKKFEKIIAEKTSEEGT